MPRKYEGRRKHNWGSGIPNRKEQKRAERAFRRMSEPARSVRRANKHRGCAVILMTGGAAVTGAAYALSHWL